MKFLKLLKDLQLVFFGLILALGFIICATIFSSNLAKNSISVTGSANQIVISDSASWHFEIVSKNIDKAKAYNQIKNQIPTVKDYLFKNGIKPGEIELLTTTSYPTYKTNPETGEATENLAYYNFSQTVKITSKDVHKIKELSNDIQLLLDKGVNVNTFAPEYQYSGMSELKVKLLEEATKDAKIRAKAMLKATRNNVGGIRSVKMGVFQITPSDSNEVSDWGVNDSSTIDKKVTAVANVVFSIR